jgi:hypothetical protein
MKLFFVYTMLFVGSIWKNKESCWFLFIMSLGLLMATEIVLTAGIHHRISTQVLLQISLPDITEPMKLFLVHTMLFVGSIWKNKSGWFLFLMSLGLLMATELVLTVTAGIHHRISSQVLLQILTA